jgi:pectate lyase
LRNVIIGADQGEGVYCLGSCNLEFVWFEDVCEDAISIKGDGTANIIGGGAYHASDKVIQHNGCGHVNIVNFYANDYGKVYRSCGNCADNCARSVHMEGTTAVDGGELIGINTNLGDVVRVSSFLLLTSILSSSDTHANAQCFVQATYSNNCFPKVQCQAYEGCDKSEGDCEPEKLGEC